MISKKRQSNWRKKRSEQLTEQPVNKRKATIKKKKPAKRKVKTTKTLQLQKQVDLSKNSKDRDTSLIIGSSDELKLESPRSLEETQSKEEMLVQKRNSSVKAKKKVKNTSEDCGKVKISKAVKKSTSAKKKAKSKTTTKKKNNKAKNLVTNIQVEFNPNSQNQNKKHLKATIGNKKTNGEELEPSGNLTKLNEPILNASLKDEKETNEIIDLQTIPIFFSKKSNDLSTHHKKRKSTKVQNESLIEKLEKYDKKEQNRPSKQLKPMQSEINKTSSQNALLSSSETLSSPPWPESVTQCLVSQQISQNTPLKTFPVPKNQINRNIETAEKDTKVAQNELTGGESECKTINKTHIIIQQTTEHVQVQSETVIMTLQPQVDCQLVEQSEVESDFKQPMTDIDKVVKLMNIKEITSNLEIERETSVKSKKGSVKSRSQSQGKVKDNKVKSSQNYTLKTENSKENCKEIEDRKKTKDETETDQKQSLKEQEKVELNEQRVTLEIQDATSVNESESIKSSTENEDRDTESLSKNNKIQKNIKKFEIALAKHEKIGTQLEHTSPTLRKFYWKFYAETETQNIRYITGNKININIILGGAIKMLINRYIGREQR